MPCIVAMPTPLLLPIGMLHSGASVSLTTTLAQIGNWVAEAARPDSIVTGGNVLGGPNGGSGVVSSSVAFSNSQFSGRTISVEIRLNGSPVATASGPIASSGSLTLATPDVALEIPAGAQLTYWASATATGVSVTSNAASYLRATPV